MEVAVSCVFVDVLDLARNFVVGQHGHARLQLVRHLPERLQIAIGICGLHFGCISRCHLEELHQHHLGERGIVAHGLPQFFNIAVLHILFGVSRSLRHRGLLRCTGLFNSQPMDNFRVELIGLAGLDHIIAETAFERLADNPVADARRYGNDRHLFAQLVLDGVDSRKSVHARHLEVHQY